ncbi:hypothetical protein EUTSA_v10009955mg [Eutrema salsugineum]|uniref:DUF4408 domain-containing protein n=1 Tax=Eutrema salsugineum TaxID=72664 RepID=V4KDC8_EUTSA|nr:uncharacterized protein LOC18993757 [Eutrema salsugineum]ESQ35730.1 hypothetical protein EUTSA_v10009955mg [Eutrema salsugineum]
MVSSTIKAVLISTGITFVALFLKASVPIALDFSLSRSPILWSSFLSCLKPPYLFVVINVIITIIVASSSYHDGEEDEIFHGGDYNINQSEPIVNRAPPRWLEVKDVDSDFTVTFPSPIFVTEVEKSEDVYEEKKAEEISGQMNGGDVTPKLNQVPSMSNKPENIGSGEKPPVSARSDGHRKPVKGSPKGGKKRKALRVAKPKRRETTTLENTWKMITEEGKSTTLTSHYRRSDAGEVQPALRKSVTFRDMTNYQKPPTPPVKIKKEMSPSREELNRRVEAFIKKCKEERLESMRLDK